MPPDLLPIEPDPSQAKALLDRFVDYQQRKARLSFSIRVIRESAELITIAKMARMMNEADQW
jgi:hypothetical protein